MNKYEDNMEFALWRNVKRGYLQCHLSNNSLLNVHLAALNFILFRKTGQKFHK